MVKLGLGDSYEKTIIPRKIRAYIDITKPASSIGVALIIPFAAIIYADIAHGDPLEFLLSEWTTVLFASFTVILIHGGSQALNMAEDADMDRESEHKQNRPIPAGVITEEEARSLAWIFIFVGVGRAYTTSMQFGGFATILALMGVFYNLEPIRAKKVLWVNLIWQAISRGLLLFPAAFAVWSEGFNGVAWGMGVVAFFLVLSLQNSADLPDVMMDDKYNITTPAVYHGAKTLVMIMAMISAISFGSAAYLMYTGIIPMYVSIYILMLPVALSLIKLWRDPHGTSNISGQSTVWYAYYGSLAGLYTLPSIQILLA